MDELVVLLYHLAQAFAGGAKEENGDEDKGEHGSKEKSEHNGEGEWRPERGGEGERYHADHRGCGREENWPQAA